ncbi:tudor and KH domain-containing protein homolog [Drosophila grimshawi]|uniref:GH13085 n=1 Tax=Drosophila grimshawi TaxID=7222 RepID=B4JR07_DROGR|nr:tudor and KH domain-containing protein homolog [Drosophila grimshawi]XP_032595583.1 tudor and KH domain-containing protein homolog [Drosophila grimshawi]XP_032595584.1 tudor and KH domain-containing protein homolog [Drosophila grimshawi]EDV99337.1 GH13085 [Drosophila grimshawi]
MLRNTPFAGTPTYKLLLGFGLCSLGSAMLYAYFKSRNDDTPEEQGEGANNSKQQNQQQQQKQQKEICLKIVLDNDHVPLIIGRGGANIKLIEEKTGAKIRLRDKDSSHKFCDINGLPDAVKAARGLLIREIERAPIVKVELQVTQRLANKIYKRGGEIIQDISRASLAKLSVDPNGRNGKAKISIVGNQKQVNIARKLLEDQIEEEEELRRAVDEVEQLREPRRSPSYSLNSSMYSSQTSLSSQPPRDKLMAARGDDKPMEVYVSAVASPTKFWVQLVGPQSKKLDDMVKEMTSYYSSADNRAAHQLTEPYVGQIVAAVFKFDEKWYRAEIVDIMPNQYNPNELVIDLYFVDYGDSEYISPADICELRTDFLTLRFQAVECFLANVKSTITDEPTTWTKSSICKFEELTEVAHWRKLIARVVTYKERPKVASGVNAATRDGTPLPGVELFDPTEGVEVNIGDLLITHGFAQPLDAAYPVRSRSTSPSTQSDSTIEELCATNTPRTPLTPVSPMSLSLTNEGESAEDAHFANQLQHLGHKLNNGNDLTHINPVKLTTDDLQNRNVQMQPSNNKNNKTHADVTR